MGSPVGLDRAVETIRHGLVKRLLKTWVRPLVIPPVRAYMRHFPIDAGKRQAWELFGRSFEGRSHRFVASTVFGTRMAGDAGDLIDGFIYYFGIWEPNLTDFFTRRLEPGDLFVDVGANIGYYTLLASQLVGAAGAVVAIEASPSIYRLLTENVTRNGVKNVRAVNLAASDRPGTLRLYRGPRGNRSQTTILGDESSELECEVAAMPLHEILLADELRRARLVKIDVEGAEGLVIAGFGPLLTAGREDLEVVVEISPERLTAIGHSVDDLTRVFGAAGFRPYALANDYSFASYLPPRSVQRPVRIHGRIREQTDVVFSRVDVDQL